MRMGMYEKSLNIIFETEDERAAFDLMKPVVVDTRSTPGLAQPVDVILRRKRDGETLTTHSQLTDGTTLVVHRRSSLLDLPMMKRSKVGWQLNTDHIAITLPRVIEPPRENPFLTGHKPNPMAEARAATRPATPEPDLTAEDTRHGRAARLAAELNTILSSDPTLTVDLEGREITLSVTKTVRLV